MLLQAGIVSRAKHGTSSVYSIADPGVFELCEQVCGGLRRQVSELDAILHGDSPHEPHSILRARYGLAARARAVRAWPAR